MEARFEYNSEDVRCIILRAHRMEWDEAPEGYEWVIGSHYGYATVKLVPKGEDPDALPS